MLRKRKKQVLRPLSPQGIVNTHQGGLNIRPSPSTRLRPLATAPKGARLTILEQGEWCRVEYRGIRGFARGQYVLPLDVNIFPSDGA